MGEEEVELEAGRGCWEGRVVSTTFANSIFGLLTGDERGESGMVTAGSAADVSLEGSFSDLNRLSIFKFGKCNDRISAATS